MKYEITFTKSKEKASPKCQKLKKRKNCAEKKVERSYKKIKRKTKKDFYVSRISKDELKTVFLIWLLRLNSTSDNEHRKISNSVVSNFFPTPRKLLRVSIIRTDTLRITSFTCKENVKKIWWKYNKFSVIYILMDTYWEGNDFLVEELKLFHSCHVKFHVRNSI